MQRFSKIVDNIYDCAFDTSQWPQTLRQIAEYTDSAGVALDFMDLARDEPIGAFSYGFQESFRDTLIQRYARIWMIQSGFHVWPIGVPMHLPDILPEEEFVAGAFYREWCRPQQNRDYVGMIAFRDSTRFVKMTNARLESQGSYHGDALRRLRLLAPHICKSVSISDAFRLERVRAGMFETMLDNLTTGVLLVEPGGRVDYTNAAARQQLASTKLLKIDQGILRIANRETDKKLQHALRSAQDIGENDAADAKFITIADGDRAGFIATVLPLWRSPDRALLQPGRAALAVFLRDPKKRPVFAVEAFAEFHGLTPGETRVAAVLGQGGSLATVCDMLGISLPTAKTHLGRIFEKTGTSRQSDLMALMTTSSF